MGTGSKNIISLKLFNLFLSHKNRPFIFVEPGENYGGFLIWKGAQKLADLAKIDYRSVGHKEFMRTDYPEEAVIYIHGGGGASQLWETSGVVSSFLKALESHRGVIILGPQTFKDVAATLAVQKRNLMKSAKDGKVIVFARECTSYEELKANLPSNIEIELDHDTALNLDADDLKYGNLSAKYTLYSIREDKEAVNIPDKDYLAVWLDPILHCRDFNEWVRLHANAKKIITNRLHSAVLGSILGKPTVLLPNSYHKNRGVWEFSLKARGVEWSEEIEVPVWNRAIRAVAPLKKIADSYKFQGTLQVFYGVR